MTVKVRFFASLAETMGRREMELPLEPGTTVGSIWAALTADKPMPQGALCAVNHEYCTLEQPLADGDEVAFFPPVTGG